MMSGFPVSFYASLNDSGSKILWQKLVPSFYSWHHSGVPVLTTSTFVSIISAYGRTILLLHSCFKMKLWGFLLLVSNPRKQAKHSDWCTIHHPCWFQFSEDCVHFALAGSVPSAGLWFTTVSWRVPSSKSRTHLWLYIYRMNGLPRFLSKKCPTLDISLSINKRRSACHFDFVEKISGFYVSWCLKLHPNYF